jgi:hypothetical protein
MRYQLWGKREHLAGCREFMTKWSLNLSAVSLLTVRPSLTITVLTIPAPSLLAQAVIFPMLHSAHY